MKYSVGIYAKLSATTLSVPRAGGTLQVRVNLEFSTHQDVREELTSDGFIKWL